MTTTQPDFLAAGAFFPLAPCLSAQLRDEADVVIVPLAAAFTGATQAAIAVAESLSSTNFNVEALLIHDREAAATEHFALRVREADAVIFTDGSPLHLRTTLRGTSLADALSQAKLVVALGAVASVFGAVMIDPRGGAPTTGLGLFADAVLTTEASTVERTRELLGDQELYVVDDEGALYRHGGEWYVATSQ